MLPHLSYLGTFCHILLYFPVKESRHFCDDPIGPDPVRKPSIHDNNNDNNDNNNTDANHENTTTNDDDDDNDTSITHIDSNNHNHTHNGNNDNDSTTPNLASVLGKSAEEVAAAASAHVVAFLKLFNV